MKIGGFAFVRDTCRFDYPMVEAVRSVLPLCDDFVLAVGKCGDGTLELAKTIDPKVRILETVWDENLKGKRGRVFSQETDKAFEALPSDLDWTFYIQCDEVLHEKYLPVIRAAMEQWKNDPKVEGLLLKYRHFYGSYDYVGVSYRWYPREIRIVRRDPTIFSYIDAQSFRKRPNKKLQVKLIDAYLHHYGYVREPQKMAKKINMVHSFCETWQVHWRIFDYSSLHGHLAPYTDTHPAVMEQRIKQMNWTFLPDPRRNRRSLKDNVKYFVERLTGYRLGGFKNYKLLRPKK